MKLLILTVPWLCLAVSLPAKAQNVSLYEGSIPLVDGDTAVVRYEYYESKGKRRFHGNYQLQATSSPKHDSLAFEKLIWRGTFTEDKRNGGWNYQHQRHHCQIKDIDNFKINYTLASLYNVLEANYIMGVPHGRWMFSADTYAEGIKTGSFEQSSFTFNNGFLSDAFEFTSREKTTPASVTGSFDQEGFLHGLWTFNYTGKKQRVREVRSYEHGFLLSLVKLSVEGDTLEKVIYSDVTAKLAQLNESDSARLVRDQQRYPLLFDLGYHQDSPELKSQQAGNILLKSSIQKMFFLDTTLRVRPQSVYGTARFIHPVSEKDRQEIRLTKAFMDSIEHYLNSVTNRNFLELNSQHSDSMAWSYEWLEKYSARAKLLSVMTRFLVSKEYHLVDPKVYFYHHANSLYKVDTVQYTFETEQKTKLITFHNYPVTSLTEFKERMLEEMMLVKRIVDHINTEMKSVLQSYQILKLEGIILDLQEEVENKYAGIDRHEVKVITEIFRKRFLNAEFNRMKRIYATSIDFDKKLEAGYDLLNFLGEVQVYPETLQGIYNMQDSIDHLYTESRLDPYTFSYVDVKVKKRLYEKAGDLFLHLMEGVSREADAHQVTEKLEAVKRLQARLVQLRMQNTLLIENQIKPKSTPEEIRRLIGV